MPGFDPEIGKLAQRVLINPRKIDYHTGVFASKVSYYLHLNNASVIHVHCLIKLIVAVCFQITPAKDGKPVTIELIDAKTKEPKETLEVSYACLFKLLNGMNFVIKMHLHRDIKPYHGNSKRFSLYILQVDAALIATGRAPFTQGLGLENVCLLDTLDCS